MRLLLKAACGGIDEYIVVNIANMIYLPICISCPISIEVYHLHLM